MLQIPAIVDGELKLFESHAILVYLACAYPQVASHWYPSDVHKRAKIHSVLDWHHSFLRRGAAGVVFNTLLAPLSGIRSYPQVIIQVEEILLRALSKLEHSWLKDGPFLNGNSQPTIADLLLACEVMQLELLSEKDRDRILSPYVKVLQWVEDTKRAISPYFDEVHELLFESQKRFREQMATKSMKNQYPSGIRMRPKLCKVFLHHLLRLVLVANKILTRFLLHEGIALKTEYHIFFETSPILNRLITEGPKHTMDGYEVENEVSVGVEKHTLCDVYSNYNPTVNRKFSFRLCDRQALIDPLDPSPIEKLEIKVLEGDLGRPIFGLVVRLYRDSRKREHIMMERFLRRKSGESSSKTPEFVDLDTLPTDPADRKPISSYNVNQRDEIRRAYILRGPYQPEGIEFPQSKFGVELSGYKICQIE
ncbi:hypothetical protein M8C21_030644, partial [Ambrosia artemisiifolia]